MMAIIGIVLFIVGIIIKSPDMVAGGAAVLIIFGTFNTAKAFKGGSNDTQ